MVRSKEESNAVGERGMAIYESVIAPRLSDEDRGLYIAIDVNSGEWEASESEDVSKVLRKRVPDADIFLLKHIDIVTGYFGAPSGLLESLGITNFYDEVTD